MIIEEVTRLVETLILPSLVLMAILAVLTMRAVVRRDRAMVFGKAKMAQDRRLSYERTWRNHRLTNV